MMRWRGVHHVEFAVLDYDDSIAFYDAMFVWLGYSSFFDVEYGVPVCLLHDAIRQPAQLHWHSACSCGGRSWCTPSRRLASRAMIRICG